MRFPGSRKTKHYFPVNSEGRVPFEYSHENQSGNYIVGVDQLIVDIEVHVSEDFLVKNWDKTPLASEYKIFDSDNKFGQQYRTDIGPIDILAERKDGKGFLVIELKRDRASDKVIGQILRYMGYVEKHLCTDNQTVSGCIIAQEKDQNLEYALTRTNDVEFLRYELNFRLTNES